MNTAIVGSNFALKGYLPAIQKIKRYKLKIICSRKIHKIKSQIDIKNVIFENNWKKIFKKNIKLIILAVPPVTQEKILKYNLKFKKKIIFEKPISQNIERSKKIVKLLKKNKIKVSINLTYLNNSLFRKLRRIIKTKKLGEVKKYNIIWSFKSADYNNKVKTWKTDEKLGGGIKNIFLTHVLSYCEFLFGINQISNIQIKCSKFKGLNYKNHISFNIKNEKNINGKISIFNKKKGDQFHKINIIFEKGNILLFTKSKDWTKYFKLTVQKINKKPLEIMSSNNFQDGRSAEIYFMLKEFLKKQNYTKLNYCLNAEKINHQLN